MVLPTKHPKDIPCTNVQKMLVKSSLSEIEFTNWTCAISYKEHIYLTAILKANSKKKKHFP